MGGLHDYIFRMPRETLIQWALTTEKYHRKVNNQEHLLGGLDDYINSLSTQEIANYILKEAHEHPELDSKEKLDALVQQLSAPKQGPLGGDGGLHDYLFRLPREKLITYALTTEAYHRDITHLHLMGGLDDYVNSLSNQQIVDYILKQLKEHPEINNAEKLDSLSLKYNIDPKAVHGPTVVGAKMGGDGGLHDYIFRLPRETLINWALATERYHNGDKIIMGGLHDYIYGLTNQQLITHIMKEVNEHPELAHADKLNALVAQYGFSSKSIVLSSLSRKWNNMTFNKAYLYPDPSNSSLRENILPSNSYLLFKDLQMVLHVCNSCNYIVEYSEERNLQSNITIVSGPFCTRMMCSEDLNKSERTFNTLLSKVRSIKYSETDKSLYMYLTNEQTGMFILATESSPN